MPKVGEIRESGERLYVWNGDTWVNVRLAEKYVAIPPKRK